jgi:hypothetical protein
MESTNAVLIGPPSTKEDEEVLRRMKRLKLKELNAGTKGMKGFIQLQRERVG